MVSRNTSAEKASEKAVDQVQEKADAEVDQGYRGVKVDPTPNEHYTVAGVTEGKPTPETDPDAADAARAALRGV